MKSILYTGKIEIWYQDSLDNDLWHGEHGVLVNTAALNEREAYFQVSRIPAQHPSKPHSVYYQAA